MDDASSHAEVGRFMRSREGKERMERFEELLVGRTIIGVDFVHCSTGVNLVLDFGGEDDLDLEDTVRDFAVETLRSEYAKVLEREYYRDFPERHTNPDPSRLRCPSCGQSEAFAVETWQCLTFYADGTVTEGDEGHQWDTDSPCRCGSCQHEGTARDFLAQPGG